MLDLASPCLQLYIIIFLCNNVELCLKIRQTCVSVFGLGKDSCCLKVDIHSKLYIYSMLPTCIVLIYVFIYVLFKLHFFLIYVSNGCIYSNCFVNCLFIVYNLLTTGISRAELKVNLAIGIKTFTI